VVQPVFPRHGLATSLIGYIQSMEKYNPSSVGTNRLPKLH